MRMSSNIARHTCSATISILGALRRIDELGENLVLFAEDEGGAIVGSLTDGDVRRAILKGLSLDDSVSEAINRRFAFVRHGSIDPDLLKRARGEGLGMVPVLDDADRLVDLVDFNCELNRLPTEAVIMAGGRGTRLHPITRTVPKPLVEVGNFRIVEHVLHQLRTYGIVTATLVLNYKADVIESFLGDGSRYGMRLRYFREPAELGTAGALSLIDLEQENLLLLNADLLSTIDYEAFFEQFEKSGVDLMIATTPYEIAVPYAVLEQDGLHVKSLEEKPRYRFEANAGIYFLRRRCLDLIPRGQAFGAPELAEALIADRRPVGSFLIRGYWLDIGKPADLEKARNDIPNLPLKPFRSYA